MIQTENERQFYLGMAGVRLWYAREPLPAAAPSPEFVFDEPEQVDEESAEVTAPFGLARSGPLAKAAAPVDKGQAKARVSNLQALIDGSDSSDAPVQAAKATPKPEPQPVLEEPLEAKASEAENEPEPLPAGKVPNIGPLKLNLQFWKGKRFVLISDLSNEASLKLQETLAENILKSVGEQSVTSVGPISWPVFNNLRAPGNSLADLRSVLDYALKPLQGQKVIVLGALLPEVEGDWLERLSGRAADVQFPLTLAELASDPNQKRALWEALKTLVR